MNWNYHLFLLIYHPIQNTNAHGTFYSFIHSLKHWQWHSLCAHTRTQTKKQSADSKTGTFTIVVSMKRGNIRAKYWILHIRIHFFQLFLHLLNYLLLTTICQRPCELVFLLRPRSLSNPKSSGCNTVERKTNRNEGKQIEVTVQEENTPWSKRKWNKKKNSWDCWSGLRPWFHGQTWRQCHK